MTLSRGRTTLGALGLAAAGLLAISACGSDNNSTSTASTTPAAGGSSSSTSSASSITCASGTLNSSGSTAQQNAVDAWTKAYQQACSGATINYAGGGSGQGYTDFTAGTDDFAGSDYALTTAQLPAAQKRCGAGTPVDLPMTPGAIAVGYNLPGITGLKLSASTLAKIFSGKITSWNDPAIAADNAGVNLPTTKISTFHRSDGSGTSFNFTNYLTNDAASDWTYGANKAWPGPGGQGEKGSSLVASTVKSTPGGIGYFELSYATTDGLSTASIGDSAGNFIAPSAAATTQFLSTAKVVGTGGDLALKFDYSKASASASSYPNTLVTYEFVCTSGNKNAALLKNFLAYTSGAGQQILGAAGYVPLPTAIQTQVQAEVAKIS